MRSNKRHGNRRFDSLTLILMTLMLAWPTLGQEAPEEDVAPAENAEEAEAAPEANPPSPSEPAPEPRFTSRDQRDQALLAEAFPQQARRLTTTEGELIALFHESRHTENKGTAVLLYTGNRSRTWSPAWENLRQGLPYYGWATLALSLPPAEQPAPPPRPAEPQTATQTEDTEDGEEEPVEGEDDAAPQNDEAQNEEQEEGEQEEADQADNEPQQEQAANENEPDTATAGTDPLLTREQRIAARLDAAMALLAEEGQENLILVVDNASAPQVLDHLLPTLAVGDGPGESAMAAPIRALILVNRYPAKPLSLAQLQTLFAEPELPVLDLFPTERPQKQQRRLHQGIANQQNLTQYRSVALPYPPSPTSDDHRNAWVRRFQTFMDYQAWDRR